MTTQANRKRLADLMEARRQELGLTWDEVAAAAGMSREGLRRVREGDRGMRPLTKSGIERALGWGTGSVDAILAGGAPAIVLALESIPSAEAHGAPTVTGTASFHGGGRLEARGEVSVSPERQQEMLDEALALIRRARELGRPEQTPEERLRESLRAYRRLISEAADGMDEVDEAIREREAG